jgi:hypothetical protein
MISRLFFPLLALTAVSTARAQTSDFPGASDFPSIVRPANSFIIGAMHIDNDEYSIPLGPVGNSEQLGKSKTVTGPIDELAYAGPKTTSTLTTYTGLVSQLTAAGYKEEWSCARATCGNAFNLSNILDKSLIATIHEGNWGILIINDLNATNNDVRFGVFRRSAQYMLVMSSLDPGYPSGAMLIRVNGPAGEPVTKP